MVNISYIIVTYNGENHIKRCIESIRNFDKKGFILVIDNASTDNTVYEVEKLAPDALMKLQHNNGFGKANNIGLKYLYEKGFDFFYLVNQDLYFHKGNYELFLSLAKQKLNQDYAIISPMQMGPNGNDFDFKFESYISQKNTPNLLRDLKINTTETFYESKGINAAAWVISKETLKNIGYFDPIFNHYGEDTDYIARVKYKQLKIGVLPSFYVIHNRPQNEFISLDKLLNQTKIWIITYFKNLNSPLYKQLIRFPIVLYDRIKKSNKKWTLYFKMMFFALVTIVKININRKKSKQDFAFLDSIVDYEYKS